MNGCNRVANVCSNCSSHGFAKLGGVNLSCSSPRHDGQEAEGDANE